MKALIWKDETLGAEFVVGDIPADLMDAGRRVPRQAGRDRGRDGRRGAEKPISTARSPTEDELKACIRKGTVSSKFVPVLCGSAFKNKGVQPLLDAVVDYLPSPIDVAAGQGHRRRRQGRELDAQDARTTSRSRRSRSRS